MDDRPTLKGEEIEITKEMIEAGVVALLETFDESLTAQARAVFEKMIGLAAGLKAPEAAGPL